MQNLDMAIGLLEILGPFLLELVVDYAFQSGCINLYSAQLGLQHLIQKSFDVIVHIRPQGVSRLNSSNASATTATTATTASTASAAGTDGAHAQLPVRRSGIALAALQR